MSTLISIPEYYARFIDPSVDLNKTPKVCCPFHHENTPSFSYSPSKGVWRCFGACKAGGDVIAMHQRNYRLPNRTQAEASLAKLLGYTVEPKKPQLKAGKVDEQAVTHNTAYARAALVANTVEDWLELDYIMSIYPPDTQMLEAFYNCRRH